MARPYRAGRRISSGRIAGGRGPRWTVRPLFMRPGLLGPRLLGVVDTRPQIAHGIAQCGELARSYGRRRLIDTGLDLGERVLERGDLSRRRRQLILLRGDLAVRGGEPLLGIERVLGDQLLQIFDVTLQAASAPVHALLTGAELDAGYVLRSRRRRGEWRGRCEAEREAENSSRSGRRWTPPSPFFRGGGGGGG